MPVRVQVAVDCADPHRMAAFWAAALDYVVEQPGDLVSRLLDDGAISIDDTVLVDGRPAFADVAACSCGSDGPRLFFQRVPEAKQGKNRVHLDLHVGADRIENEAARLEGMGAHRLWFSDDRGGPCWTMADIEGNEFCLD